jgi:uncharacterized protein
VKLRHWFLAQEPDVLPILHRQVEASVEFLDAFVAWSAGDATAEQDMDDAEQRAGKRKRELWRALRTAFSTPLDAEDLYSLSFLLDEVLNGAHSLVNQSDVLGLERGPGPAADMARLVRDSVSCLGRAIAMIATHAGEATVLADDARHSVRGTEDLYRDAMRAALDSDDLRRLWATSERYGRYLELADRVIRVSDRVWYAVVKEA